MSYSGSYTQRQSELGVPMRDLPRIAELYLMIRRPLRPTFPHSLEREYLDALERVRSFTIQFGSAQKFQSEARRRSDALQDALDGKPASCS